MKKGATITARERLVMINRQANVGTATTAPEGPVSKKQSYVSWNKEMDKELAEVLVDQMARGNKWDGDTWKPQAYHAVVVHLNSKLNLNLTKDNIKNRLKVWKKHYSLISDVQTKKSGFTWDEDRKMIVVTPDLHNSWAEYVESNPDAKGMANKVVDNWENIALLCGKDRANGLGAEQHDEGAEIMGEEEENEVDSARTQSRGLPTLSSDFTLEHKKKKSKKDSLGEAVGLIATSFQEFVASKKVAEPTGIEIHEVVFKIPGLTRNEIFKGVRKLMIGDPKEFELLKDLPEGEKAEWIRFIIES